MVTICTASLTLDNSTFCPHSVRVFMCSVWISEQTAIISLYSINWLLCITEKECVYCAVRTESLRIIEVPRSLQSLHIAPNARLWPTESLLRIVADISRRNRSDEITTRFNVPLCATDAGYTSFCISFFLWTNSPFGYTSVWDAPLSCVQSGKGLSILLF